MGELFHFYFLKRFRQTICSYEVQEMNTATPIKILFTLLLTLFCIDASPQDAGLTLADDKRNDSIITCASQRYESHSLFRQLFMGTNYRRAWSQPVKFPVFYLSRSGFTVKELGGGMQTMSLQLRDAAGKQWALRTVEKQVAKAMPGWAKNTLAQKLSQDQVSASFPYGASIAIGLAAAAGITAAPTQIYFIADDTALGEFRSFFANTLCSLQERDAGVDNTVSSRQLLTLMRKENRHAIDQKALLHARLLDMLIADWDRHEDNWRWQVKDTGTNRRYSPIPKDRDWAFFRSNGLLPYLVRFTGMRFLVPFSPKSSGLKNLNNKVWLFDKLLLNELDRAQWENISKAFVQQLPDSAIETAVKTLPKEIYALHGQEFINILKSRRNGLAKNVMDYYEFVSEEIIINGSDEEELIQVSSFNDQLTVSMYKIVNGQEGDKIYERSFSGNETYHITINAFDGDDRFEVGGNTASKIKLTLNGGKGNDTYNLEGALRTKVYETASEKSTIRNKNKSRISFQ
jgi:hypothetical protein